MRSTGLGGGGVEETGRNGRVKAVQVAKKAPVGDGRGGPVNVGSVQL